MSKNLAKQNASSEFPSDEEDFVWIYRPSCSARCWLLRPVVPARNTRRSPTGAWMWRPLTPLLGRQTGARRRYARFIRHYSHFGAKVLGTPALIEAVSRALRCDCFLLCSRPGSSALDDAMGIDQQAPRSGAPCATRGLGLSRGTTPRPPPRLLLSHRIKVVLLDEFVRLGR